MSHNHVRSLIAILIVPLSVVLGCASSGAKKNEVPAALVKATDTSSIANGDGKTLENLFAGRFPGVIVMRAAGGGIQIRIRGGSNTFYGDNEPLYLVDDVPVTANQGGIIFVNPYDIQRIEVLKNPEDIGVYGIRGSNGVVKITMKKPGRR